MPIDNYAHHREHIAYKSYNVKAKLCTVQTEGIS